MKTQIILLPTLILLTMPVKSQSYLETGVFYSKTQKEWINIDDIQAISDIDSMQTMRGGYIGPEIPDEVFTYQGQYYFVIKYKRGNPITIYKREKSEIKRLHKDFLLIWKRYKSYHINHKNKQL